MANLSIISNDQASGLGDCIANDIPSRAFRYATESKNVLSTAGAMYIGTGLKRKTTMLLDAPNWESGYSYHKDDIVTYSGHNYKAINDTTDNPAGSSNWSDISITYTSYVTAVLEMPDNPGPGMHLGLYYITALLYQDDNKAVYKDANGYIVGSNTPGASTMAAYFPCWLDNNNVLKKAPFVIGSSFT